jgi:hypothetical protein
MGAGEELESRSAVPGKTMQVIARHYAGERECGLGKELTIRE